MVYKSAIPLFNFEIIICCLKKFAHKVKTYHLFFRRMMQV